MISRLSGRLVAKQPPTVVVDVHGVGYELDVPMSTFYQLPATGADVVLLAHLVVREDAHLLFGFATEAERAVFRQLLKITGIGARIALAVLSGLSVDELRTAVARKDGARLTRIPGIGKKTAERLILELQDKLAPELGTGGGVPAREDSATDALNALLALGYSEKEARGALGRLAAELPLQDAIRQALKLLARA